MYQTADPIWETGTDRNPNVLNYQSRDSWQRNLANRSVDARILIIARDDLNSIWSVAPVNSSAEDTSVKTVIPFNFASPVITSATFRPAHCALEIPDWKNQRVSAVG